MYTWSQASQLLTEPSPTITSMDNIPRRVIFYGTLFVILVPHAMLYGSLNFKFTLKT